MADLKISQLTGATTPLAGTEVLPIIQSGVTVKVANNDLRPKQIQSNATSGVLQVAGPGTGTTRVMTTPNANFTAARTDAAQTLSGVQTYLSGATAGTNSVLAVFSDNTYPNSAYPTLRFDGFGGGNGYSGAIYATEYGGITLATSNTFGGTYTSSLTLANGSSADVTVNKGNIVPGTAGKGINFTANTNAPGMTSELLNWYEEGTWTPTLSFQTPGNLSVAYAAQVGSYTRIGNRVVLQAFIALSSFTHTTASGFLRINGIPFNGSSGSSRHNYGSLLFSGITKAGYTQFVTSIEPSVSSSVLVYCSGSGITESFISAADMPTGGTVNIKFTMTYEV